MPAPTDLTWQQFNDAFSTLAGDIVFAITSNDNTLILNIPVVLGVSGQLTTNNAGVIKFLTRCLEAARIAQEQLNQDKPVGERLTAFPTPTTGTPANGFVPITRTLTSRARLASATEIIGTTA